MKDLDKFFFLVRIRKENFWLGRERKRKRKERLGGMCWLFFSAKTKDACFLSNGVESFEAEGMGGNCMKFKGIFNNFMIHFCKKIIIL